MCVTTFVATALPPDRAIGSRRSRYSEQPPRMASRVASASRRITLLNGRIGFPPWQIEHVTSERPVRGDCDTGRLGRQFLSLLPRDLGLPEQEEVDVIRRQRVIGRRLDLVAGPCRTH